jgi:hypothetical protein
MPPRVFRANWTKQPGHYAPETQIDLPTTVINRNTTKTMFQVFTAGIGGTCDRFQPPAGYWCSNAVQGGGSTIYAVPTAMQVSKATLPNLPYVHTHVRREHTATTIIGYKVRRGGGGGGGGAQ